MWRVRLAQVVCCERRLWTHAALSYGVVPLVLYSYVASTSTRLLTLELGTKSLTVSDLVPLVGQLPIK